MKVILLLLFIISLLTLNSSEKNGSKTINQITVKEYALCSCISEGLAREGIKTFDGSAGHILFNWQIGGSAFFRIDSAIENLYDNSNIDLENEKGTSRGYFIRCLKFYKSNYLDSLVNSMNESISMNEEDEEIWRKISPNII